MAGFEIGLFVSALLLVWEYENVTWFQADTVIGVGPCRTLNFFFNRPFFWNEGLPVDQKEWHVTRASGHARVCVFVCSTRYRY